MSRAAVLQFAAGIALVWASAAPAQAWRGATAQFDLGDQERPLARASSPGGAIWDEREYGPEFALDVTLQNIESASEGYWSILLRRADGGHYELFCSAAQIYLREQPGADVVPSLAPRGGEIERVDAAGQPPFTLRLIALAGRLTVLLRGQVVGQYFDLAPLAGQLGFAAAHAVVRFGPVRASPALSAQERFQVTPSPPAAPLLVGDRGAPRVLSFVLSGLRAEQAEPSELPDTVDWRLREADHTLRQGSARLFVEDDQHATFHIPIALREPHRLLSLDIVLRTRQGELSRFSWFVSAERAPRAPRLPDGYLAGVWARNQPRGDLANRLTYHYAIAAAAAQDGFNYVQGVGVTDARELDVYQSFGLKAGILLGWWRSRPAIMEHPAVHALVYGDEPQLADLARYLGGIEGLQGRLGKRPSMTALIGEHMARPQLHAAFWRSAPNIEAIVRFYPYRRASYGMLSPASFVEMLGVDTFTLIAALVPAGMRWYLVPQAFGHAGIEPHLRPPSAAEVRLQLILGNLFGASGFVAFSYDDPKYRGLVDASLRPNDPPVTKVFQEFAASMAAWPRDTLGVRSQPARLFELPWRLLSRRLSDGTVALVNLDAVEAESFVAPPGFRPAPAYRAVSRASWSVLPDGRFRVSIPPGDWAAADAPADSDSASGPGPIASVVRDVLERLAQPVIAMPRSLTLPVPRGLFDLLRPSETDAPISLASLLKILDANRAGNYGLRLRARTLDAESWRLAQLAILHGAAPVRLEVGTKVALAPLGAKGISGLPPALTSEGTYFRFDATVSNPLLFLAPRALGKKFYVFVINLDPSRRQRGTVAARGEPLGALPELVSRRSYPCTRSASGTRNELAVDLAVGEMAVFDLSGGVKAAPPAGSAP